jgi:cell division inhibitor SulA/protein ImuA
MKPAAEALARLPGVWRAGELEQAMHEVAPTGYAVLDRELPGGGWPLGTLSEVLHDGVGLGEVHFLCGALARASQGGRLIAWIGAPHLPYAPGLAAAGVALERCVVVEPAQREDALWAAEQSLRSGACGAVLLWLPAALAAGPRARSDDYAWLRRLQLAAQAGRAMAVLYRSSAFERASTPAHLRVALAAGQGALAIRIPKRRGPPLVMPIRLALAGRHGASLPEQPPQAASQPLLVPAEPRRPLPRLAA